MTDTIDADDATGEDAAYVAIEARLKNPAALLPGAFEAIQGLIASCRKGGVPKTTMALVHMRVSQINGCSFCVNAGWSGRTPDESEDRRLVAVGAWREAPYFTAAERAALALAECVTRLSDRPDPVPDEVWDEAARHFDEPQLAALVLWITTSNVFNRINVTTRQPAGSWG
jgi:alkylhydroperoxidase family enzyme